MHCKSFPHRVSIIILITVIATIHDSSSKTTDQATDTTTVMAECPDFNPQNSLNWTQIEGQWYAVEVVKHKFEKFGPMTSGRVFVKTCPVINLRFTGSGDGWTHRSLRLLWTEDAGNLDYSFYVPSNVKPGKWKSKDKQNGTLLAKGYVQFVGDVQVMKATESHLALTFCSTTADNQLYTVILSRGRELPLEEIRSIEILLSINKGLNNIMIKQTCANSGSRDHRFSVYTLSALAVFTILVTVSHTAIAQAANFNCCIL
ncbi:uncharacterized protein LOC107223040 [Neodiprion lecontei]|uniref:Uncharacterized protein LOC107223040 n=1 Tax=Neodiprion lecontei TaxID=441921 RepID=A0A6J0BUN6_NEOLC|nr:uncharacterized protein LOC107223040 [Neodiprion lecontei]